MDNKQLTITQASERLQDFGISSFHPVAMDRESDEAVEAVSIVNGFDELDLSEYEDI